MKIETAKHIQFNFWLFIATSIIFLIIGMYGAFATITKEMSPVALDFFYQYLADLVKYFLFPNMPMGKNALVFLQQVHGLPTIEADYLAKIKIIFYWTPIGSVITNAVFFILGHSLKNYYLKNRGGINRG